MPPKPRDGARATSEAASEGGSLPTDASAVAAPNDATAAQYYPAIHWYSMLKIPGKDQFGGKSDIPAKIKQSEYLNIIVISTGRRNTSVESFCRCFVV